MSKQCDYSKNGSIWNMELLEHAFFLLKCRSLQIFMALGQSACACKEHHIQSCSFSQWHLLLLVALNGQIPLKSQFYPQFLGTQDVSSKIKHCFANTSEQPKVSFLFVKRRHTQGSLRICYCLKYLTTDVQYRTPDISVDQ